MVELSVVRRYTRALFATASRAGLVAAVESDLLTVDRVLRSLPRLQRVLRAPTISGVRKKGLVATAFSARVSPLALRFLNLVVDRRREDILPNVYAEFHRLANEARNILPVEVTAATPLTDAERAALLRALAQRTGKEIVLRVDVDSALMGGLVIRMGDTIVDGSVRSRLAQLRNRLLTCRLS